MNEHIEEIAKYFISLKPKRMGAVLLPTINGFDVYEFDEDSLRVIIHLLGKNSEIKAVTRDKASQDKIDFLKSAKQPSEITYPYDLSKK